MAADSVTFARNIVVNVSLTPSSPALANWCLQQQKSEIIIALTREVMVATPGPMHIWDIAICWTFPPPAHPARGVSAHHYLPLPLIASTQHWQWGNTSEARSCRRGSRCLMVWFSFWQFPPDWQINMGWLWPISLQVARPFAPPPQDLRKVGF